MSSLIDLILGQKIILLTIGVAVLLMVTAISLAGLVRLRTWKARHAQLRAERAAQAEIEAAEVYEDYAEAEPQETDTPPQRRPRNKRERETGRGTAARSPASSPAKATGAASVAPALPAAARPAAPAIAIKTPAVPAPAPAAPAAQQTPAAASTGKDQPVSGAMQDLLSSVFNDEESNARQEVLMRGLGEIEMEHLVTLASQVADKLHGRNPVVVVKSEELA